jgi:hypothetical protein
MAILIEFSFAFVEFSGPVEALAACKQLDMVPLDKKHTLRVNKLTDIERYGREGRIDEHYTPPHIEEFQEKEHLRSWLADPSGRGRDQFVMVCPSFLIIIFTDHRPGIPEIRFQSAALAIEIYLWSLAPRTFIQKTY